MWPNADMTQRYDTDALQKFIECCVKGENTWATGQSCSAAFRNGGGAFTTTNDASAEIKSAYRCSGDNLKKAKMLIGGA